jgi:hypothetical protein
VPFIKSEAFQTVTRRAAKPEKRDCKVSVNGSFTFCRACAELENNTLKRLGFIFSRSNGIESREGGRLVYSFPWCSARPSRKQDIALNVGIFSIIGVDCGRVSV